MTGRPLPRYRQCVICGDDNPCGAAVTWVEAPGGVEGVHEGAPRHCGYEGVLHGGIVAGLLDECAGWAAALGAGALCVTGELTVRYQRPLPQGLRVSIRGRWLPREEGKRYRRATAEIVDAAGAVYASCTGIFFPLPPERAAELLPRLEPRVGGPSASELFGGAR